MLAGVKYCVRKVPPKKKTPSITSLYIINLRLSRINFLNICFVFRRSSLEIKLLYFIFLNIYLNIKIIKFVLFVDIYKEYQRNSNTLHCILIKVAQSLISDSVLKTKWLEEKWRTPRKTLESRKRHNKLLLRCDKTP